MCVYCVCFGFHFHDLYSWIVSPFTIFIYICWTFGFIRFQLLSQQSTRTLVRKRSTIFVVMCAFILFSVLFLPCIYNKCQEFWLFNVRRMTTHLWIRFIVIKSLDCFCFHIIHLIYATTIVKSFFVLERWNWNDVICTKYCSYVCIIHDCHNNNDNTFIWISWFESS